MLKSRKLIMWSVLVIGMLILASCGGLKPETELGAAKGALRLTIEVGEGEEQPGIAPQTVSDEIQLDKLVVTITKGTEVLVQEVAYDPTGANEVVFDGIASGDWMVDVVAKDIEGYDCYGGSAVATVLNSLTVVPVDLFLLNGNLDLLVKMPAIQGTAIVGGKVTLVNPRVAESHVEMELAIGTTEGTADFGSVKAGTWYMEVELYDANGNTVAWGSAVITVLPSRENQAVIEFDLANLEGGTLKVVITVNLSPADPTGLMARVENGQVVLTWDANPETNIVGYTVYRAGSETGFKKILTYEMVNDTTYTDATAEVGKTYYYWVQAYNADGYSSDLSGFALVEVSESTGGSLVGIDETQYNQIIYVDDQGSDETGDGSLENPYAHVDTALRLANDGDLVYILKGTYRLRPMIYDSVYVAAGMYSLKDVDVIGEDGKETILEWYGADSTRRDGPVFGNWNQNSIVARFTVNFYPGKQSNFNDCSSSIWRFSRAAFKNIYINVKYTGIRGVYLYFNDCPPQTPWIENCTINWEAGSYGTVWVDGGLRGHYVNCLFNIDGSRENYSTKDHSIVRAVTNDDYDGILATDLINTGVGTNPDGTQAHIGVYGGEYAWGQ